MTTATEERDSTFATLRALIVDRGLTQPEILFGADHIIVTVTDPTEVQDWADALGLSVLPNNTVMGAWRGWAIGVYAKAAA